MRGLLLLIALVAAVPDRPDPIPGRAKLALKKDILGDWRVVLRLQGGNKQNQSDMLWRFTPETMQHVNLTNGVQQPASKFPYALDASKKPAVIVFTQAGYAGILKVEGDQMTVCLHPSPDKKPPPDFISPPNTQVSLVHLTRVR